MAAEKSALAVRTSSDVAQQTNPSQTLRAATALLKKIQSDQASRNAESQKTDLLADADDEPEDDVPVWLILNTKKHIVDKKRLKPGKIVLPHPYLPASSPSLRVCLITTDPQRKYKDIIADPAFPLDLAKRMGRVIGLKKLKAKYSSFESRRQLYSEHDVFLADDRIITYLPQVLGKVFYKTGNKRPIPMTLEGKRQNFDEQGNKRRKLAEGGSKVVRSEVRPADVAREVERALQSALVHLAPSTSTAVKVGRSSMEPLQIQENVEVVTQALVEKYVPQKWQNVRSIHIKGPDTAALPIWLAEELWEDEKDVLEEPPPVIEGKKSKSRKRSALVGSAGQHEDGLEVIEVPGGDGKMRRLEKPATKRKAVGDAETIANGMKIRKSDMQDDVDARAAEMAEKAARNEALKKQKAVAKGATNGARVPPEVKIAQSGGRGADRRLRMKAVDLI